MTIVVIVGQIKYAVIITARIHQVFAVTKERQVHGMQTEIVVTILIVKARILV